MNIYPLKKVSPTELRELFNKLEYWERAKRGEFREIVLNTRHPSLPLANEPFCTKSQVIAYQDKRGRNVAIVHQYLRTDGNLGLGGKPDPKRVLYNLELYYT